MLRRIRNRIAMPVLMTWYKAFKPYYDGIAVQAVYLYKQSTLYKDRWQLFGIDFAEQIFRDNPKEQHLFFTLAKRQPFLIRYRIFMDATRGREPRPYYI